jgi:ankyrin repeat protein
VGTVLFAVTHFLLISFVGVRGSEMGAEKKVSREAAFFKAVEEGDLAAVTAELDAGFDPNHRDQYGRTPLNVVEDPRVARRLILAGADVNARDEEGSTPLIVAAQRLDPELVRLLLQSGADVHARHYDRNALEWALQLHWEENYEEVVKILREAGAKENPK